MLRLRWRSALAATAVTALACMVSFSLRVDKGVSVFTSAHPAVVPGVATKPFTVAGLLQTVRQVLGTATIQ